MGDRTRGTTCGEPYPDYDGAHGTIFCQLPAGHTEAHEQHTGVVVGRWENLSSIAQVKPPKLRVEGVKEMTQALGRIECLLTVLVEQGASDTERDQAMADTLDDIRAEAQGLGLDIDTVLQTVSDTQAQLEAALANAGVDEGARAEILGILQAERAQIANALNPTVPVDPDVPHVDNTLPGDLAGETPPA